MDIRNLYCTKYIEFGGKNLCAYCGKTLNPHEGGNGLFYLHCDCEDAKKEHEIERAIEVKREEFDKEIDEMYEQLPKVKYKVELAKISE